MEVLRTPDTRFEKLKDWDFAPHYASVPAGDGDTLRIHYADEGPGAAAPILCMHGGPTWGYLFRKLIPLLADAGHRVVVPDLVGAGRSDKPASREDYSYAAHVAYPTLTDAGHFAPETRPEQLARILLDLLA